MATMLTRDAHVHVIVSTFDIVLDYRIRDSY